MNTQLAFTFGMLAVVSIGMIIGTIVGLVKVYRLEAKVKEINRDIHGSIERVWQHLNQVETNLNRRIDETERNMSMESDDIRRNMDSRFDKFENKIKTTDKKQLLKD